MPMLPIIAVFFCNATGDDNSWFQFEFVDHTYSAPTPFLSILKDIGEIDNSTWIALRYAIQTPNVWATV